MSELLLDAMRRYRAAGLDVIPDHFEYKYPAGIRGWETRQFTENELAEKINSGQFGIGVRNVLGLDFDLKGSPDDAGMFGEWKELLERVAPGLFDRLLVEQSRSGGFHVVWKCRQTFGNLKLAHRLPTPEELAKNPKAKKTCVIETRGIGGQFMIAPSPGYVVMQGDWTKLPELTADEQAYLLGCAKSLNRVPDSVAASTNGATRPGDLFNETGGGEAYDLLLRCGWKEAWRRNGTILLTRPGKDRGVSATFGHVAKDTLYVFSSNASPFDSETAYSPFAVKTILEYNGDYSAAAKDLVKRPEIKQRLPEVEPGAVRRSRAAAKPTHDELADRWEARHENTIFGLGDWRRYEAGLWPIVRELTVRAEIKEILVEAKEEDIRPNAAMVKSVLELAKLDIFVDDSDFDSNPDLLVCKNGTLHIPTLELRPNSPDNYATTGVDYSHNPEAEAPNWLAFLLDLSFRISPAVVDFLQEFAGYALTIDTRHEIALWLYGPPGSGKSTFLEGMKAMLCSRAGLLGLADIERSRFALTNLPGKTLVISTEQPGGFLSSTHILNAIISGETITFEKKFEDPIDITPRAKIAWAMNELPRVSDPNSGLFRRVKVVEFPVLPESERDTDLKDAIKNEGAGILNWALAGLKRLKQRGRFDIPAEIATATDNFKNTNDIPRQFIEDCCVTGNDANGKPFMVQSSSLYDAYKNWCIETGHKPQSSTSVAGEWKRLGYTKDRKNAAVFYTGIGLRLLTKEEGK